MMAPRHPSTIPKAGSNAGIMPSGAANGPSGICAKACLIKLTDSAWLLNDFKSKIEQSRLNDERLCLLAHHFVPSVASAWAGAKPGNRIVRIESLWGIPEGLYWHSHDTFEVDTLDVNISDEVNKKPPYKIQDRLRYKGTFIAPDVEGNWIPQQTMQPFDVDFRLEKVKR